MFSYFVHAAKNLLAAVFLYSIPPELLDQLQQAQGVGTLPEAPPSS